MTTQITQSERVQTHKTTKSEKPRREDDDGHATIAALEPGTCVCYFYSSTTTSPFDFSIRPSTTLVCSFRILRGFSFFFLEGGRVLTVCCYFYREGKRLKALICLYYLISAFFCLLFFKVYLFPTNSITFCFCFFSHSVTFLFSKLILHHHVILM